MSSPLLLSSFGLIHVSGADAQSFLQGQLSNDLIHLQADGVQWSAYCTAKGRMLANFLLWRDGGDGFYLMCKRALVAGLVKRLRMYVLRAKAVVEDVSDAFTLGFATDVAGNPMRVTGDGDARRIHLGSAAEQTRTILQTPGIADQVAEEAHADGLFTRLAIAAGEAWVESATAEQFVPQMINFDLIGGINFKKGCYPGQEIVARAHYRGAVKRRMLRGVVEGTAVAGDVLVSSAVDFQESGMIAAAAATAEGTEVLAVLQTDGIETAEIHLKDAQGAKLCWLSLPYSLPVAA